MDSVSQPVRKYDLEERTLAFAKAVRSFVLSLRNQSVFPSDLDQLVRSSGSIGANYIEANEALGKKDFIMRIRIALKEAKEAAYWLRVIQVKSDLHEAQTGLYNEAVSLVRIFCAILHKVSSGTLKEKV